MDRRAARQLLSEFNKKQGYSQETTAQQPQNPFKPYVVQLKIEPDEHQQYEAELNEKKNAAQELKILYLSNKAPLYDVDGKRLDILMPEQQDVSSIDQLKNLRTKLNNINKGSSPMKQELDDIKVQMENIQKNLNLRMNVRNRNIEQIQSSQAIDNAPLSLKQPSFQSQRKNLQDDAFIKSAEDQGNDNRSKQQAQNEQKGLKSENQLQANSKRHEKKHTAQQAFVPKKGKMRTSSTKNKDLQMQLSSQKVHGNFYNPISLEIKLEDLNPLKEMSPPEMKSNTAKSPKVLKLIDNEPLSIDEEIEELKVEVFSVPKTGQDKENENEENVGSGGAFDQAIQISPRQLTIKQTSSFASKTDLTYDKKKPDSADIKVDVKIGQNSLKKPKQQSHIKTKQENTLMNQQVLDQKIMVNTQSNDFIKVQHDEDKVLVSSKITQNQRDTLSSIAKLSESGQHEELSNWTSLETDNLSEKLLSLPSEELEEQDVKVQKNKEGQQAHKVIVITNSGMEDPSSQSDKTVKALSPATKKKAQREYKPLTLKMLQLEANVLQFEHIVSNAPSHDLKPNSMLNSRLTTKNSNNQKLKRTNSQQDFVKHPNEELFNNPIPLFQEEQPEPAKIQERIHELLMQYRLNADKPSEVQELQEQQPKQIMSIGPTSLKAEKESFKNFMYRQMKFQNKKVRHLESMINQQIQKTNRELKFQPNTSKSSKVLLNFGKKRNVVEFIQDMEIQRKLKEKRLNEMTKKRYQDIKSLANTNYLSLGSKDILVKAGVDITKPSERKFKKKADQKSQNSESSAYMSIDEGPKKQHLYNSLSSQFLMVKSPSMANKLSINMFNEVQQQQPLKKKTLEQPTNINRSLPLLSATASTIIMMNLPKRQKSPPNPKLDKSSTQKHNQNNKNHLSSIIQNPFTHFMENTKASQNYLNYRKELQNEAQSKFKHMEKLTKSGKLRFMKLTDIGSPYCKKILEEQESLQESQQKHTKKEIETKITQFLQRQNQDIVQKTKQLEMIDQQLLKPQKVEIKEENDQPKKILDKSNKIMYEKFKKEFYSVLSKAVKSETLPIAINSFQFTSLITQLGCAKPTEMMNDESKVFKRCQELWTCLTQTALQTLPDESGGQYASVDDTKMYLMALFGIQGNKRMGVAPPFSPERVDNLPFGFLDDKFQINFTQNCIDQIKQRFSILLHNRTRFMIDKTNEKRERQAKAMFAENTFKPNLGNSQKMNEKILNEKKQLFILQNDLYFSNQAITFSSKAAASQQFPEFRKRSVQNDYQRFIDSKNFWIKFNQQKAELKQKEDCTFKPDIRPSKYDQKTTYVGNYYMLGRPQQDNASVNSAFSSDAVILQDAKSIQSVHQVAPLIKSVESLDLHQAKRFEQLYLLTNVKNQKRKQISQVSWEEKDFELQKEQCTFKPNLVTKSVCSDSKVRKQSMTKEEIELKRNQKLKLDEQRVKSLEIFKEKEKHAQMIRKWKKDNFTRGNTISQKAPPLFNLEETKKKVNESMLEKPFLYIDVEVSKNNKDRIAVYRNDSPRKLSLNFCNKHNFNSVTHEQLVSLIKQRIKQVSRIDMVNTQFEKPEESNSRALEVNKLPTIDEHEEPNSRMGFNQEVGGRLNTQTSSFAKSINSNPLNHLVDDLRQLRNEVRNNNFENKEESTANNIEDDHSSPAVNRSSGKGEKQFITKSIDRIKNFKNFILNDFTNPLSDDEQSQYKPK